MNTNLYILIGFSFLLLLLIYKVISSVNKIEEMRSLGSNIEDINFFNKIIKKIFLKNLPN